MQGGALRTGDAFSSALVSWWGKAQLRELLCLLSPSTLLLLGYWLPTSTPSHSVPGKGQKPADLFCCLEGLG